MAYSFDKDPELNFENVFLDLAAGVAGSTAKKKSPTEEDVRKSTQELKGLNKIQMYSINELGLNRDQVLSSGFGVPTALAVGELKKLGLTAIEAFNKVEGLGPKETSEVVKELSSSLKSPLQRFTETQVPSALKDRKPFGDLNNRKAPKKEQNTKHKKPRKPRM